MFRGLGFQLSLLMCCAFSVLLSVRLVDQWLMVKCKPPALHPNNHILGKLSSKAVKETGCANQGSSTTGLEGFAASIEWKRLSRA